MLFPAAERSQSVATAEGRGVCLRFEGGPEGRKISLDSYASPRLALSTDRNHGLQPWLHSDSATRLDTHAK
jgi:hypothetical protein